MHAMQQTTWQKLCGWKHLLIAIPTLTWKNKRTEQLLAAVGARKLQASRSNLRVLGLECRSFTTSQLNSIIDLSALTAEFNLCLSTYSFRAIYLSIYIDILHCTHVCICVLICKLICVYIYGIHVFPEMSTHFPTTHPPISQYVSM